MYTFEYLQIYFSAPPLWAFTAAVTALLFLVFYKTGHVDFRFIGTPLTLSAVAATFFPVDTAFCINRDTLAGYCFSEMSTGILILISTSYPAAAGIYKACL
jgi:hypothetical protein